MIVVYDASRTRITLDQEIDRGGEGGIYLVRGRPDLVAKLYSSAAGKEPKLAWMVAHPPTDPTAARGHVSIAWPRAVLYDSQGACIGFLMSRIQEAVKLFEVFNPRSRAKKLPGFNWLYLHRTAHNFASGISAIHAADYVIGDVNEGNALVMPTALVTVIDTDSFQVRARRGGRSTLYTCPVGKLDYTPPELQGKSFVQVERQPEHDAFGLAVLIFQLLMEGNHPFRARWLGAGDAPALEEKISLGYFPHQRPAPADLGPPTNSPPIGNLHPDLVFLFQRCFVDGHRNPRQRPTAAEWDKALGKAEQALIQCANGHYYSNHLASCPWCARNNLGMQTPLPPVRPVARQTPRPAITVPSGITRPAVAAQPTLQQLRAAAASLSAPQPTRGRGRLVALGAGVLAILVVLLLVLNNSDGDDNSPGGLNVAAIVATNTPSPTATPPPPPTATQPPPTPTPTATPDPAAGCWTTAQRRDPANVANGARPYPQWSFPPARVIGPTKRYAATLQTTKGPIQVDLAAEAAPTTVNNFVCLARANFFNETSFYRAVPGSVLQAGDPSGTGNGNPGYQLADEPVMGEYTRGTLAMVNGGPDTNGSRFFIFLDDLSARLPKRYTIFGHVTAGLDIADAIAADPTTPSTIQQVIITELPAT